MRNWLNYNSHSAAAAAPSLIPPHQSLNKFLCFVSAVVYLFGQQTVSYWITPRDNFNYAFIPAAAAHRLLIKTGPRRVCAHIHHQSFPFDVGASAFCLVRRGLFGFKAAFISSRVKSVLLIILLSADMVCEVAANELLLYVLLRLCFVFICQCVCVRQLLLLRFGVVYCYVYYFILKIFTVFI